VHRLEPTAAPLMSFRTTTGESCGIARNFSISSTTVIA
jgi:hypothetical protein